MGNCGHALKDGSSPRLGLGLACHCSGENKLASTLESVVDGWRCARLGPSRLPLAWVPVRRVLFSRRIHDRRLSSWASTKRCTVSWDSALNALVELQRHAVVPALTAYDAAINACARSARWQWGLLFLTDVGRRGEGPYNSVISACARGSQWTWALHILSTMRIRGPSPTAVSYGAVLSALEKGKQWERALSLHAHMQKQLRGPNLILQRYC